MNKKNNEATTVDPQPLDDIIHKAQEFKSEDLSFLEIAIYWAYVIHHSQRHVTLLKAACELARLQRVEAAAREVLGSAKDRTLELDRLAAALREAVQSTSSEAETESK